MWFQFLAFALLFVTAHCTIRNLVAVVVGEILYFVVWLKYDGNITLSRCSAVHFIALNVRVLVTTVVAATLRSSNRQTHFKQHNVEWILPTRNRTTTKFLAGRYIFQLFRIMRTLYMCKKVVPANPRPFCLISSSTFMVVMYAKQKSGQYRIVVM